MTATDYNLIPNEQNLPAARPLKMPSRDPGSLAAVACSISASALAELHDLDQGGPPHIFLEMVELFNESTAQLLSEACKAVTNPTQLRMIAHTLKGSCSNFGAHAMEALCLELEQPGDGPTRNARDLIDAIEQEFFKVQAALANHCAGI